MHKQDCKWITLTELNIAHFQGTIISDASYCLYHNSLSGCQINIIGEELNID